ncbi:MAG: plastocyanin/azurin family copper-binding protein [Planctomycetota bacterium]
MFSFRALGILTLVVAGLMSTGKCQAADETISFFDLAFVPTTVSIQPGDTVTFQWMSGIHTVTSGVSSNPADNPGLLFDVPLNAANPTFQYTFSLAGSYSFFDREHETGLVGTIIVNPFEVEVEVVDNAFTPEHVTIFAGDRIRWQWIEGSHTATSGASSNPADNPGALFNAFSTVAQPVFTHVFADAGFFPYFCVPHETIGMIGSVTVQELFIRGDTNRDGTVNIADPVALLTHLFGGAPAPDCGDAADSNDDGGLDIADAVATLGALFGANTVPLPGPYPNPGADRTADTLLCL